MKNLQTFLTVFLFIAATSLPPAKAQDDMDAQQKIFIGYIADNTGYKNVLIWKMNQIADYIYPGCKDNIGIKRLKPITITKPQFITDIPVEERAGQNPNYGQWIERGYITACGQTNQINVLAVAYDAQQLPNFYPMTNGQTRIEPNFQSKAMKAALEVVPTDKDECPTTDNAKVRTTYFLSYRGENNTVSKTDQYLGFFEQWAIENCGTIYQVNLAVLPDSQKKFRFVPQLKSDPVTQ